MATLELVDPPPVLATREQLLAYLDRLKQLPQQNPEVRAATMLGRRRLAHFTREKSRSSKTG